jgi:hypothetical protein
MRIATFNAGNRKDAWNIILNLDVDAVLVQEAPPIAPPGTVLEEHARKTRRFATAIYSRHRTLRQLPATTSTEHRSHTGAACVAELELHGTQATLISMHCVDDPVCKRTVGQRDEGATPVSYATTTAHRLLSDLTGYLGDRRRRGGRGHRNNFTVLGGDLNINPGFDARQGNRSHQIVLDRIADFGLNSAMPIHSDSTNETCVRSRIPFGQIDYLFVSNNAAISDAQTLRTPELTGRRDHLPILASVSAS